MFVFKIQGICWDGAVIVRFSSSISFSAYVGDGLGKVRRSNKFHHEKERPWQVFSQKFCRSVLIKK